MLFSYNRKQLANSLKYIAKSQFTNLTLRRTMVRITTRPHGPQDVQIKGVIFDMDGTLCLPQVSSKRELAIVK